MLAPSTPSRLRGTLAALALASLLATPGGAFAGDKKDPDKAEPTISYGLSPYGQVGLQLTDAFCGFKAYRREALARLRITEAGWGMPLQLWVQAAKLGLRIKEVGVPRVYLDPNRAFGGVLNNSDDRLAYYRRVIADAEQSLLPCSWAFACCD